MKFLVDMPVTPRAVALLRARGQEAVHAQDVGLDLEHAIVAVDPRRIRRRRLPLATG